MAAQKLYEHQPHNIKPTSLEEHRAEHWALLNSYQRAKTWLAIKITTGLGTMECAVLFAALAIYGFPQNPNAQQLVQWISQTFIQLTCLSILGNGQQILGDIQEHIIREISKNVAIVLHQDRENTGHLDKLGEKGLDIEKQNLGIAQQNADQIALIKNLDESTQKQLADLRTDIANRDDTLVALLTSVLARLDAQPHKQDSSHSSIFHRMTHPLQKTSKS